MAVFAGLMKKIYLTIVVSVAVLAFGNANAVPDLGRATGKCIRKEDSKGVRTFQPAKSGDSNIHLSFIPPTNPESELAFIPPTNPEGELTFIPPTTPESELAFIPPTGPGIELAFIPPTGPGIELAFIPPTTPGTGHSLT